MRRTLARLPSIMNNTPQPLHDTVGALGSSYSNRTVQNTSFPTADAIMYNISFPFYAKITHDMTKSLVGARIFPGAYF